MTKSNVGIGDVVHFPRVLVLTRYPFNLQDGGGIALTNYFHSWPSDRLAQTYLSGPYFDADKSVCRKFHRLTHREIKRIWPLQIYHRLRAGFRTVSTGAMSGRRAGTGLGGWAATRLKHAAATYLRKGSYTLPVDCRITDELAAFIEEFRPEVLFTTLGDLAFVRLAKRISQRFDVPVALQICDDWMSDHYVRGFHAARMRGILDRELRELFEVAAIRFSICQAMSEAYKERYGLDFLPLPCPVDFNVWYRRERPEQPKRHERLVVYAGSVMPFAQLDGLVDISRAVERLNREGLATKFLILSLEHFVHFYRHRFDGDNTVMSSYAGRDEIVEVVGNADLLVLPVNFDAASFRFIKYSMPAKIAAYMASGTPILVYGPPNVPLAVEAAREAFAYTVTERDMDALTSAIRTMLTDEETRRNISNRAAVLAKEKHDIERVSAWFRGRLLEACRGRQARC